MTTEVNELQQEAANLADYLARGHHYAGVHLARLIKADTNNALHPFAVELARQIQSYVNRVQNPKMRENRLAQLETELYEIMVAAAERWDDTGYREVAAKPTAYTCQMVRVNGQTCNAPAVKDSRFCRYHLTHDSDW
jgi:hypothetical protein